MSSIPGDLKFSPSHEWIRISGSTGTVGITDHAQKALGDITYIELPEAGDGFAGGECFGSIESVKAASDLYLPLRGTVLEVNSQLEDEPAAVNQDPYGRGWLIKIQIAEPSKLGGLLDADGYAATLGE